MLVPFKKPCSFMAQFSSKWLYNYICERNPVGYYSNYRPQSFLAAFREIICVMKWRFPAAANKPISNLFCKSQATLNGVIQLGSIHCHCICLDFGGFLIPEQKMAEDSYLQNAQMCSKMINNATKKIKIEAPAIPSKCEVAPLLSVVVHRSWRQGTPGLGDMFILMIQKEILLKEAFLYKPQTALQSNECIWKGNIQKLQIGAAAFTCLNWNLSTY